MGMIKPERDSRLDELITKEEAVNAIEQSCLWSAGYSNWDQQVPHHAVVTCTGGK